MANPSYTPITVTGTYYYWPDWLETPFDLSYAVELAAGTTGSYTLSYTLDDINDTTWTPIWLPDPTNSSAQTTSQGGYYNNFRIRGLRLVVSAIGGTSSIRWAILQGLSSR